MARFEKERTKTILTFHGLPRHPQLARTLPCLARVPPSRGVWTSDLRLLEPALCPQNLKERQLRRQDLLRLKPGQLILPVISELHDELLKSHCKTVYRNCRTLSLTFQSTGLSPNFRASNPLCVISLLAGRPGANRYPLTMDIDSVADVSGPANVEQNMLYRLVESSASLAHAIMMVSASDLALQQVDKAMNDRLVIYHKSRALALLNEAIRNVQSSGTLETLATAAVLACHEVCQTRDVFSESKRASSNAKQLVIGDYKAWTVHILGFSRMIAVNGGINFLDRDNPVRRLILWSDQVGALVMNMQPLFPASAVFTDSSRLSQNMSQQVTKQYREGVSKVFCPSNDCKPKGNCQRILSA